MFLHTFIPPAVALVIGPLTVYWYGLVMAAAMAMAIVLAYYLARYYDIEKEVILDLAFWLIIGGLIGARIYEIFLELPYYIAEPASIIKIWQGGLAIHGALLGGALALILFARKRHLDFWKLAALCVPAVALGQAIGRWGNWFNQELFGLPTAGPWGIPIEAALRPLGYESFTYFQPTFLYESLGCLLIAAVLVILLAKKAAPLTIVGTYAVLYGLLRFLLEFIKIDPTPGFLGLRWPQVMSLVLVLIGAWIVLRSRAKTITTK